MALYKIILKSLEDLSFFGVLFARKLSGGGSGDPSNKVGTGQVGFMTLKS